MEKVKSDTKNRELLMTRKLNAPVDLVWEVWVTPEHIANWWGPEGFTNTIKIMDFTPGGIWEFVMHGPDGTNYENKLVFNEIVPFKKIVYEHITYPHIIGTILFEKQEEQTILTWHALFDNAEEFIKVAKEFGAEKGLVQNLNRLGRYVSEKVKKVVIS